MNTNQPALGSVVSYARADQNGAIHQGQGVVLALFLNPDKRPMVQVRDGQNAWNCDLVTINATPEQVEAYGLAIGQVQALTVEGNDLVKATVSDYNARVQEIYDNALGKPLEIPEPETQEPAPEESAQTLN